MTTHKQKASLDRQAAATLKKLSNKILFARRMLQKRGAKIPLDFQKDCFAFRRIFAQAFEPMYGCHVARVFGCGGCENASEGFNMVSMMKIEEAKSVFRCVSKKNHKLCVAAIPPVLFAPNTYDTTNLLGTFKAPTIKPTFIHNSETGVFALNLDHEDGLVRAAVNELRGLGYDIPVLPYVVIISRPHGVVFLQHLLGVVYGPGRAQELLTILLQLQAGEQLVLFQHSRLGVRVVI